MSRQLPERTTRRQPFTDEQIAALRSDSSEEEDTELTVSEPIEMPDVYRSIEWDDLVGREVATKYQHVLCWLCYERGYYRIVGRHVKK